MIAVRQIGQLARRSIVSTCRQPAMVFPSVFFPLMIAAVNTAAMARSIDLPGFPKVDSFLDFMMATTIVQGVLFGVDLGWQPTWPSTSRTASSTGW